jgi:hypothetical protein
MGRKKKKGKKKKKGYRYRDGQGRIRVGIGPVRSAIISVDSGTLSYQQALSTYDISPNSFHSGLYRGLGALIKATEGDVKTTLEEIAANEERKKGLFNMGDEFVRAQYDAVRAGEQKRLCKGIPNHPDNVDYLMYYAIALDLGLEGQEKTRDYRKRVVEGIKHLPSLIRYLTQLKLGGVVMNTFDDKPLAVLESFDRTYQRKTGDKSLFDLKQDYHLHPWGDNFNAPEGYWNKATNVEDAIYHELTEYFPGLASRDRGIIEQVFENLPLKLRAFLSDKDGLHGLMSTKFKGSAKTTSIAIKKAFNNAYMRIRNQPSLL